MRLHDDRREEEGQVRLLPLHRLQRPLRQHIHPRGTTGSAAGRRSSTPIQIPPTSPTTSRRPYERPASPNRNVARRRWNNLNSGAARCRKLDRGYDDYRRGQDFRGVLDAQVAGVGGGASGRRRRTGPRWSSREPPSRSPAQKILELAKQAEFLYKSQNPAEQRRLLETVLSNCTFDRGTLCPTYS